MYTLLSHSRKTAAGSDGIPFWVFKDCTNELCDVVATLVNTRPMRDAFPEFGNML